MYLLNHRQIRDFVQKDPNHLTLYIDRFEVEQLQHTSYYFRLGEFYAPRNIDSWSELSDKNRILELKPGDYFRVKSYETFFLSDKILGIFGPSSDIIKSGLRLVHGPFIDPLFNHLPLLLGLHNPLKESVQIAYKETLGKICFFNISDTYPVLKVEKSSFMKKGEEQKKLWQKLGLDVPEGLYEEDITDHMRENEPE